jgi:hypothetical protein
MELEDAAREFPVAVVPALDCQEAAFVVSDGGRDTKGL